MVWSKLRLFSSWTDEANVRDTTNVLCRYMCCLYWIICSAMWTMVLAALVHIARDMLISGEWLIQIDEDIEGDTGGEVDDDDDGDAEGDAKGGVSAEC